MNRKGVKTLAEEVNRAQSHMHGRSFSPNQSFMKFIISRFETYRLSLATDTLDFSVSDDPPNKVPMNDLASSLRHLLERLCEDVC